MSFAPLIVRLHRGLDRMSTQFGMEFASRLAIESAGRTTIVFDSRRVDVVFADHCMMEDSVDRCSS